MVVGVQGAIGLSDEVGAQDQTRTERDVVTEPILDEDVHPEFLAQFADQGLALGLPRRHLAAGQFPQTGQLRWAPPLGDQQSTAGDQRPGHDYLHGL